MQGTSLDFVSAQHLLPTYWNAWRMLHQTLGNWILKSEIRSTLCILTSFLTSTLPYLLSLIRMIFFSEKTPDHIVPSFTLVGSWAGRAWLVPVSWLPSCFLLCSPPTRWPHTFAHWLTVPRIFFRITSPPSAFGYSALRPPLTCFP